ncbi:hypothetical protein ACTXT7_003899 [Hymenolepis weldensis]
MFSRFSLAPTDFQHLFRSLQNQLMGQRLTSREEVEMKKLVSRFQSKVAKFCEEEMRKFMARWDDILQPLTQHSLPLNGTGVNTWACHIAVLVLKQRQSLHRHLLYSPLLTSEFDDTVTCLLKALQPTCDYENGVLEPPPPPTVQY